MLTEVVAQSLVGRASFLLGVWHPLASLLAAVAACSAFAWLREVATLSGAVRAKQRVREKLFCYAKVDPELQEMADEGLVLAARAKARLGQALSAVQHAEGHLQIVGVGNWKPTGTRPAWNAEPRLTEEDS